VGSRIAVAGWLAAGLVACAAAEPAEPALRAPTRGSAAFELSDGSRDEGALTLVVDGDGHSELALSALDDAGRSLSGTLLSSRLGAPLVRSADG
jgi:hypothetical protein